MADALSGLLAGLNQGVQTGLQLYQVVEGQKRAQREEDFRLSRAAVEDSRYAQESKRADEKVASDNDHWDKTFQFNNDKMAADTKFKQDKLTADNLFKAAEFKQRGQIAADASQRGWAAVGQSKRRNDLAEQGQRTKTLNGYIGELGKAAGDPNLGMDGAVELMNGSPAHRMAGVTKLQQLGLIGHVPPDVVGRMTLVPTGDGRYAVGVAGDDGKIAPYDPDGVDGPQKAVTVSSDLLSRTFGGQTAVDAEQAKATLSQGQAVVGGAATALNDRAQSLSGTVQDSKAAAEKAAFAKEFETTGPRATYLSQQADSARASDTWAGHGGAIVRTDPSTGKRVMDKVGEDGQLQNPEFQTAQREHRAALSQADNDMFRAGETGAAAQADLNNTTRQARSLSDANQLLTQRVQNLPVKDRAKAVQDGVEVIKADPMLFERYPGKDLKEASDLFTKDRNGFIDRVVGAVDFKTMTDVKGKPVALEGGKANLRAVLSSMPKEMQMALMDYTGQAEGALQKAAQGAASMGKPEAVPYLLYSDNLGIDSQQVVKLMQDPALMGYKDQGQRFALAAQAMDLVKSGGASDVEAALGKVLARK